MNKIKEEHREEIDAIIKAFETAQVRCLNSEKSTANKEGCFIRDSGNRTEFSTGSVRDMREGKGRCDLMPLDVVAKYIESEPILNIYKFQQSGDCSYLYRALTEFIDDSTYIESTSETVFPFEHDVITMLLEVAKHFEEGCKKYGENNWRKGIPVHCYIDSAVRHYLKYLRGDKDEPHDRAFCWNILCCIWTVEHIGNDTDE